MSMKINVFGLGYVGCVTAACLANEGHEVIGIDVDRIKVNAISKGDSPIVETGLHELIRGTTDSGRLTASTAISEEDFVTSDVSIVCVGTPSEENGELDLKYVRKVSEELGDFLKNSSKYHVVNIRSTVLPGTSEEIALPILEERSGKRAGVDFGLCMNPEFMREGTSIEDFNDPPFTVIGEFDKKCGGIVASLYKGVSGQSFRTTIKAAEMIKYACNTFHALKVVFANEIGNICKNLEIDSHDVMDIFIQDTKLNISPYYLKPGFAFGGSCLPKDLRALLYKSRMLDLEVPVLNSIMPSNNQQIETAFNMIRKAKFKKVGMLGLSFKKGTDDLRESPMVDLAEKLIGKGYTLSIYDREVSLARIFGSNREYINKIIPHISSLIKESIEEVVEESEIIVCCKKTDEYVNAILNVDAEKTLIDLARLFDEMQERNFLYEGICW